MVEAIAARRFLNVGELRRTILQHHATLEVLEHFLGDLTTHTHRVLAVHLVGRVHQAVGQLTVGGEQQQAGGVDVQAADVDPAADLRARQTLENGRTAFRIIAGADFAFRLVVDQHATNVFSFLFALEQTAVDADGVMAVDALAESGGFAVDLHPAFADPGLDIAARSQPHAGQDLLQLLPCGAVLDFTHLGTSRCSSKKAAHHTRPLALRLVEQCAGEPSR
ncbi:hypothetical protein D9M72_402840 [compost metagenome]